MHCNQDKEMPNRDMIDAVEGSLSAGKDKNDSDQPDL